MSEPTITQNSAPHFSIDSVLPPESSGRIFGGGRPTAYFSGHDFIETLALICFISPNHMAPKARRRVAPTRHVVASAETEALRIGGSFPDAASCHAEVAERRRKSDEDGLVTP